MDWEYFPTVSKYTLCFPKMQYLFENDEKFDNSAAENAAAALKNLDITVDEACSRIDKFGRMALEFKIKKTPDLVINKLQIMRS